MPSSRTHPAINTSGSRRISLPKPDLCSLPTPCYSFPIQDGRLLSAPCPAQSGANLAIGRRWGNDRDDRTNWGSTRGIPRGRLPPPWMPAELLASMDPTRTCTPSSIWTRPRITRAPRAASPSRASTTVATGTHHRRRPSLLTRSARNRSSASVRTPQTSRWSGGHRASSLPAASFSISWRTLSFSSVTTYRQGRLHRARHLQRHHQPSRFRGRSVIAGSCHRNGSILCHLRSKRART